MVNEEIEKQPNDDSNNVLYDEQNEESFEDEQLEDEEINETNEIGEPDSWQRDDKDDKTIVDRMHQTEAPKKIEELRPSIDEEGKDTDEENMA